MVFATINITMKIQENYCILFLRIGDHFMQKEHFTYFVVEGISVTQDMWILNFSDGRVNM